MPKPPIDIPSKKSEIYEEIYDVLGNPVLNQDNEFDDYGYRILAYNENTRYSNPPISRVYRELKTEQDLPKLPRVPHLSDLSEKSGLEQEKEQERREAVGDYEKPIRDVRSGRNSEYMSMVEGEVNEGYYPPTENLSENGYQHGISDGVILGSNLENLQNSQNSRIARG